MLSFNKQQVVIQAINNQVTVEFTKQPTMHQISIILNLPSDYDINRDNKYFTIWCDSNNAANILANELQNKLTQVLTIK